MSELCLWCANPLRPNLSLTFLLSGREYTPPRLCRRCQELFIPPVGSQCPQCGRFQAESVPCRDCQEWKKRSGVPLVNQAVYPYHGIMQSYLERYKFQGDYVLRWLVKQRLERCLQHKQELIIPIPITATQRKQRKFNQVEGWLTEVVWVAALVARPRAISQHQQTRAQRLQTREPFTLNEQVLDQLQGSHVCLVDDVYTTGQTLHEAQRLLLSNGVQTVRSVTLAR
ncbi:ComF family protein [Fructilactobacillus hinvesii]|uniref:ComF family protein n=1 Tax=Fructilactobacillus hinvesii TaxID=2940300 RepID=A0ABY5BVW2_9LACO|nr:phosphoribosyltransferase family protein [Fructilactobacillus hinvesii]USS87808.1 ComF family protein [Fructilactobacillus hinvesii]